MRYYRLSFAVNAEWCVVLAKLCYWLPGFVALLLSQPVRPGLQRSAHERQPINWRPTSQCSTVYGYADIASKCSASTARYAAPDFDGAAFNASAY